MDTHLIDPPEDAVDAPHVGSIALHAEASELAGLIAYLRDAASEPVARPAKQPRDGDELLDTAAAARLLGISPSTLAHWRSDGLPTPPPVRLGRRAIRYRRAAVLAWAASRETAA